MSQELDNNVLDLAKQKGFYPYEYMGDFKKFKEKLLSKEKFYSSLSSKKISVKENKQFLMFRINLKWKPWNIITICI